GSATVEQALLLHANMRHVGAVAPQSPGALHVRAHLSEQVSPFVVVPFTRLPSSHASVEALMPSPQIGAMQLPATQWLALPHAVPAVFGIWAEQVCVLLSQAPEEMQALSEWQSLFLSDATQEYVQSGSQPSPVNWLPSSHSSSPSILLLPQYLSVQTL